jgi:hypothetical protein
MYMTCTQYVLRTTEDTTDIISPKERHIKAESDVYERRHKYTIISYTPNASKRLDATRDVLARKI